VTEVIVQVNPPIEIVVNQTAPITIQVAQAPVNTVQVQTVGIQGPKGDSYQETFESVSKNIKSWAYSLNYTLGVLTSIVYTSGLLSVTKTFNYTSGVLVSIVLSGDTPSGITLTKTLNYTTGSLTSVSYS